MLFSKKWLRNHVESLSLQLLLHFLIHIDLITLLLLRTLTVGGWSVRPRSHPKVGGAYHHKPHPPINILLSHSGGTECWI